MGTYQEKYQQTQCSACPVGTNTASTGSTSRDDCLCKYSTMLISNQYSLSYHKSVKYDRPGECSPEKDWSVCVDID